MAADLHAGPCLVLGAGSSGGAAARLLRAEGREVTVIDAGAGPELEAAAAALRAAGCDVRLGVGDLPPGPWASAIASPGVAPASPWMRALAAAGVPVAPEFELGWSRRGAARVVAVTGSNGKSSAAKWLAETLVAAGARVAIAGNYGPPVCDVARARRDAEWMVMEVSSFQLETARAFRPEVGVLLNVQPNHLNRHGTLEEYLRVKASMFSRARSGDVAIVPAGLLDEVKARAAEAAAAVRWITFGAEAGADYRFRDGAVARGGVEAASVRGTYFDNAVLGLAAAAVVAATEATGHAAAAAAAAAVAFRPLPHRLETVHEADGLRWIDDSKATSLTAMMAALRMLDARGRIRLIAGGRPKETDFSAAKEVLSIYAAGIYLIGECAEAMRSAWAAAAPCRLCGTVGAAIEIIRAEAKAGDIVLLSPACASFDQFRNFEERGDAFARRARGP